MIILHFQYQQYHSLLFLLLLWNGIVKIKWTHPIITIIKKINYFQKTIIRISTLFILVHILNVLHLNFNPPHSLPPLSPLPVFILIYLVLNLHFFCSQPSFWPPLFPISTSFVSNLHPNPLQTCCFNKHYKSDLIYKLKVVLRTIIHFYTIVKYMLILSYGEILIINSPRWRTTDWKSMKESIYIYVFYNPSLYVFFTTRTITKLWLHHSRVIVFIDTKTLIIDSNSNIRYEFKNLE